MSDTSFELHAQSRENVGKGASRRLRRLEDMVPGIVYGGHKDPENMMIEHRHVIKALENEAFYSHILTLTIGKATQKVVLKAVQRHPYKARIQHLDFMRVSASEAITMQVPLHFLNEEACKGVKAGGLLNKQINDIQIKCLPENLPEFLSIDLENLELDHTLHLSDIILPKGVEIPELTLGAEHDQSLVTVHMPRIQEEASAPEPAVDVDASSQKNKTPSASDAAPATGKNKGK